MFPWGVMCRVYKVVGIDGISGSMGMLLEGRLEIVKGVQQKMHIL